MNKEIKIHNAAAQRTTRPEVFFHRRGQDGLLRMPRTAAPHVTTNKKRDG